MSFEFEKEINTLRENLAKARDMRIRSETRIEQLNRQKQELLGEMEEFGVKPDELEAEIIKLEKEMENLLGEARKKLPM